LHVISRSGTWGVAALLVAGMAWVALDGLHYWHDIRFMYAVNEFSLTELLRGIFNPHQAWTQIDEVSSSGFYVSKVLHLALLDWLFQAAGPAETGMMLAVAVSLIVVLLCVVTGFLLYSQVLASRELALLCMAGMLLTPVTPYLAGKFLAEITSLLIVIVAITILARSMGMRGPVGSVLAIFAGLVLVLAGLARLDSLLGPVGFTIAAIAVPYGGYTRRAALRSSVTCFLTFIAGYLVAIRALGFEYEALYSYFLAFTGAGSQPVLMSLVGVATFGGLSYLLALAGLFSDNRRASGFFSVWVLVTGSLVILVTSNYMVEPRYLVQVLLPLAGLAGLGLHVIGSRIDFIKRGGLPVFIVAILVITAANYLLVRLMPYELDRPALMQAVSDIRHRDDDARILVPWMYTDFNFLRVIYPDLPIYNVNSPGLNGMDQAIAKAWEARFTDWYGDRYLAGPGQLSGLMRQAPVYYLGWTVYPPVQQVRNFSKTLGWQVLDDKLQQPGLMNHLEQSWVWKSAELDLRPAGQSGQYQYFRVRDGEKSGNAVEEPRTHVVPVIPTQVGIQ